MLKALQNEGITPRVLSLTRGEVFEQEILDLGIQVDYVGSSNNQFARLKDIIFNLRRQPVDAIQSVHFYTNIYAALAGKTLGVSSFGAIRSDLNNELSSNPIFGRWHLRMPRRLIVNSQLAIDRAAAKGIDRSKLHLLRNAVVEDSEASKSRSTSRVTLLFAGRLVSQKRPERFIALAAELKVLCPGKEVNFLIAGDGPLRDFLEKLAEEKGMTSGEIQFLGEQENMSGLYKEADILVLTSENEGTPNVILEAMANGMAVVATKVGGVPEILNRDCGIIVDPNQFSELVQAVYSLIVDREKRERMGGSGREFVRRNHSIGYLQKQLLTIYNGG